jgi:hypothetical protein
MAVAQWSCSVGACRCPPSVGLTAATGWSVASPWRPSCSVDGGRLLGASHEVAAPPPLSGADLRPRSPGVGHRGCHRADPMSLLCGEAGRHLPNSGAWCWPLLHAVAPHGGGDGEPWAGGWLILGGGVFGVTGMAARSH